MIVKANQPALLDQLTSASPALTQDFAGTTWVQEGKGHGRREKRVIRTAPADGIDWPHAAQVLRIRRDSGPTRGPWQHKEIAYGITSLPRTWPAPATWPSTPASTGPSRTASTTSATRHSAKTCSTSAPGTSPSAYAAIRNLVTGAFRRAGFANIAYARRYYGRDDQRILALYGYT